MILMLNGSRNWGGQPDTFLMHTYKIYFRLYLLLLPLCLASIWKRRIFFCRREMENFSAETCEKKTFIESLKILILSYHKKKYLTSFRRCRFTQNRLMNDTGEKSSRSRAFAVFSLGGFCVIKYILENLLNYPLTSSSTSWDRIILKLHTYCSIKGTADFVYLPLDFSFLRHARWM